jgi:hypothetical protein
MFYVGDTRLDLCPAAKNVVGMWTHVPVAFMLGGV